MSSKPDRTTLLTTSALILSALCAIAPAKTICVDDDATGANDGSSWVDAYKYLQDALADADSADKPVEIRVAQGIYRPDRNAAEPNGSGDRTATFQLINGVVLKGGYAGLTETDPNVRDIARYETILSGDLADNDVDIKGLRSLRNVPTWAENSFHVVTGSGTDSTAVFKGFTVTSGHADGDPYEPDSRGGGMYNDEGEPTIANCTFSRNSGLYGAGLYNVNNHPHVIECHFSDNLAYVFFFGDVGLGGQGGGICNHQSNPRLSNCTFSENHSSTDGGGMHNRDNSAPVLKDCVFLRNSGRDGGAMYNDSSSPVLTDCLFKMNMAGRGGGMFNRSSYPSLTDCIFISNSAAQSGGMYNYRSSVTLTNCSFINNTSRPSGGAMCNSQSNMTLNNCIFSGNESIDASGGAIFSARSNNELINCTFTGNRAASGGGAIVGNLKSVYILRNCIFWQNEAPEGHEMLLYGTSSGSEPSSIEVSHSVVMGGSGAIYIEPNSLLVWNEGNIEKDPLFSNPGYWDPNGTPDDSQDDFWVNGDYHLKSESGRWDPVSESWVKDDVTSPCIDAGDPNSDWGQEVWPHGGRINVGAYGGTRQASMSAEPQTMFLPRVAYVYYDEINVAKGYKALLEAYGCSTTLIPGDQVATTVFDDYDLIMAGTDTGYAYVWADEQNVAAVEGSGKPVVGLGQGGYWYFGHLGLNIGRPHGGYDSGSAIEPVDPNHPLFSEPYPIEIPDDGVLELCAETDQINIYLYPAAPDTVTTLGLDAGNPGYYSIVLENDRYLYWGFDTPAENLTEAGRKLFVNAVIRAANASWD